MRMATVFKKLLCLQGARVRHVDFRMESQTIQVSVTRQAWRHRCPHCKFTTRASYDRQIHGSGGTSRWAVGASSSAAPRTASPAATTGLSTRLFPGLRPVRCSREREREREREKSDK
jgi:hypothetical protein